MNFILTSEPRNLWYYDDAYKIKAKQHDYDQWKQGIYFAKAISCTVGNMLGGKHAKKDKYFESPLAQQEEYAKADRKRKAEAFFAQLQVMAANFELSKQEDGVS